MEHGLQAVAVGIVACGNHPVRGALQTISHIVVGQEPMKFFDHFLARAEENHHFAVITKNLAVLLRVFRQHARAHGWQFETPHHIAVAVGAPLAWTW